MKPKRDYSHLVKWQPGQSGNPAGRAKMDPKIREAIQTNGARGVERMAELLVDETAWGKDGWIDAKTQVKLAETAMTRAYGPALPIEGQMTSAAEASEVFGTVLKQVYDALKEEGGMPEFINAQRADMVDGEAKDVTPKDSDTHHG